MKDEGFIQDLKQLSRLLDGVISKPHTYIKENRNTHTAVVLVTVANSADVTLGSFNIPSGDSAIIVKGSSDQVFAGHVGVTLSPINTRV